MLLIKAFFPQLVKHQTDGIAGHGLQYDIDPIEIEQHGTGKVCRELRIPAQQKHGHHKEAQTQSIGLYDLLQLHPLSSHALGGIHAKGRVE